VSGPRVVVVGAGPAGCAAAFALAGAGVDAIVLERGVRDKAKPCGDALLPEAVRELRGLGLDPADPSLGGVPFEHIDLRRAGRRIWTVDVGEIAGWVVPRATLDQALRDRAAAVAELRYGASVAAVVPGRGGTWEVEVAGDGALHADGVVLAAGAGGSLSRGHGIDGRPVAAASVTTYSSSADPGRRLVFDFDHETLPGYGWEFPAGDGVRNVGFCAISDTPNGLRRAAERYFARACHDGHGPVRGGAGPLWSGAGDRWHRAGGLVSAGDAAGLIDPLTGEGIAAALRSGRECGTRMASFVLDGRAAHLDGYSAWVGRTFGALYAPTPVRRVWDGLCSAGSDLAAG
jgi:menaquinone-9 beta-reductase